MVFVSPEFYTLQVLKDLTGSSFMGLIKVLGWISTHGVRGEIPVEVVSALGLDPGVIQELSESGCWRCLSSDGASGGVYRVAEWITSLVTRPPILGVCDES